MDKKYDVLGVGNAIVDVLSFVDEDFLAKQGIKKGIMTLIDEETAERLYSVTGQATEISGGCAGNTVSGVVSMGGTASYIGRVKDDQLGGIFTHDLNGVGVKFTSSAVKDGPSTARSFIFVTPDAERSMLTYLGACGDLDESYVDEELVKSSKIAYVEGYLWNQPKAIAAIKKTFELAKKHETRTSFTLSDPFCVANHRPAFLELLPQIDILLCNEDEAKSLFETTEIGVAVEKLAEACKVVAITCGAKGVILIDNKKVENVATDKVDNLVDTTGAGDLFAAGFLYGIASGKDLVAAAKLGNKAAGQIIQQLGARPQKPLKGLAA